jgi:hypothetical protein
MVRFLKSMFSPPETEGTPELVRSFTSADQPITLDVVSAGGDGWRIDLDGTSGSIRMFEVPDPGLEACLVAYRAKLRTEGVDGRVYLEMWCRFPGKGEFFSKGLQQAVRGTTDWTSHETPFHLKQGQRPDLIKLNVAIEGSGTTWIKDVELLQTPLRGSR